MKLYTEKQVRKAIAYARSVNATTYENPTIERVLNSLTPIELPSDEEIRVKYKDFISHYISHYGKESFFDGAKWMKEQILNQNK